LTKEHERERGEKLKKMMRRVCRERHHSLRSTTWNKKIQSLS